MFIPLYDGVPMRNLRAPGVAYGLIAASTLVYFATRLGALPFDADVIAAGFGVVPAQLFGDQVLPDGLPLVPAPLTLVTAIFVHVSFLHLAGNMLFLWVFGDNVEDAMGHARFLVFFVACGVLGNLAYAMSASDSIRPLVGASGAVSGIIGAYLVLHPRVLVWGLFLNRVPLRLKAFWGIGLWAVFQVAAALLGDGDTGWVAHLGGFVAGIALVLVLRRRDQPVLGRDDDPRLTGDA